MLTSFFMKRLQQNLPYLLWGFTVSIWVIMTFGSHGQSSQYSGDWLEDGDLQYRNAHRTRNQDQAVLSTMSRHQSGEAAPEDEYVNSRMERYPLPVHASQPDFPNVPIAIRLPQDDGSKITKEDVEVELKSIWDLGDNRFWRMECDGQSTLPKRYEILREHATLHVSSKIKYFFALDLYQVRDLLPRLMGTIVHAMKMLGPEKCALSIVEGRSEDGTYAVLLALKEKLETIGVEVYLMQSDINPKAKGVDRIGALSELRNMALQPLIDGQPGPKSMPIGPGKTPDNSATDSKPKSKVQSSFVRRARSVGPQDDKQSTTVAGNTQSTKDNIVLDTPLYDNNTVIIFVNDIAVCTDDIYELLFQHHFQSAHQTCAMDWTHGGNLFYDSWVSRSMSGDLFFEVPQDISFAFGDNMFWDHPLTKDKFKKKQPFQVYSCWGGMVTLSSAPFLEEGIRVRNSTKDECYAGEPVNLAKDFWAKGYGKILTVPTVNVGYNNPDGKRIKKRRGWVKDKVTVTKTEADWKGTELISWKEKPPGQVKCMPGWGVVSWTEP